MTRLPQDALELCVCEDENADEPIRGMLPMEQVGLTLRGRFFGRRLAGLSEVGFYGRTRQVTNYPVAG